MLFSVLSSKFFKTATYLVVTLLTVAVFVYLAPTALAQASLGLELPEATGLGTANLMTIIVRIIQVLLGFLGIVAVLVILYGGYIYMTSEGEEDKIAKAKKILINGVIGLVIILSAFAIVTYIINRMQEVMLGGERGEGRITGFEPNAGALGGGILESVYPEPGATNVPRNTLIMVTFKEEMDVPTIISNTPHPDCPSQITCGILAGATDNPNVRIINRSEGDVVMTASEVMVYTPDNKNFVFDPYGQNPSQHLGNPNGYTDYAVNLTEYINKANGAPAFLLGGYTWFFEVSNVLDLIPPQVVVVIPVGNNVYMNAVVQIDFSEAVNAAAAVGQVIVNQQTGQLEQGSFDNITISYEDGGQTKYVSGNFTISNLFRTITFVSDTPCLDEFGQPIENSCGEEVFCLPAEEELTVTVKAAAINPFNPLSGISDAAGNSLDGGGENGTNTNGIAEGPPDDNYWWSFITNNEMWLEPPRIIEPLVPEREAELVPRNIRVKALFDTYLLSSTINSSNVTIFKSACDNQPEFPTDPSCYPPNGFVVYKENIPDAHRVVIRTYSPHLDPLTTYNPRLTSDVRDIYQNCFYPACGPGSGGECVQ